MMDDYTYTFISDVMEKKRIGRSAAKRKNGSKSKKCSLPSDSLTQAGWKKLNSEVSTYNLQKPYTWRYLKCLPLDIQTEYICGLVEHFNINQAILAKGFNISSSAISKYLSSKHIKIDRTGCPSPEDEEYFMRFMNGEVPFYRSKKEISDADGADNANYSNLPSGIHLSDLKLSMRGLFNAKKVSENLSALIPHGECVEIHITIHSREEREDHHGIGEV